MAAQPSSNQYACVTHANNDNSLGFGWTFRLSVVSAGVLYGASGLDYLTLNGVRSAG